MSAQVDRDLVEELARAVLEEAAPEELVIFEDTAAEYFADPGAVLDPARRAEAVGFGLDLALLTPYVLAVVTPVVTFLLQTAVSAAKEESAPLLKAWVRRLFRRVSPEAASGPDPDAAAPGPEPLTAAQAAQVRQVALSRASDLGLPDEQARLLADSVVGGLVTA